MMLKLRNIFGLSVLGLTLAGCYQYNNNNSFRSICNLTYAGARMAFIYKYSSQPTHAKNVEASSYLRDALRLNGGIYLKLGQLIATLDVIVPDQYRTVMSALTRQCEKQPFSQVQKTIEEELKFPIDVVFKSFDKWPISSASIAQVHRAVLLNGEQVAVKVQHRHLSKHVQSDLATMHKFVKVAKWLFKQFNYDWLVQGFEKNMRIELDFVKQAQNMKRTRTFLKDNDFRNVHVPEIMLKPTKKVIVMEYIEGMHIDEIERLRQAKVDLKQIGKTFSNMIIKMIHKEGFVHADTHAGNIMVRKLKHGKDQLVILDHGLYQEMDPTLIHNYNEFWLGLILNDSSLYEPAARHLGTSNPILLRSILTSKTNDELNDSSRGLFDLNPSSDKNKIMAEASKNHEQIIKVLSELNRQILLLLKVNEFARTIENMMSGREMGVYRDIASECVDNLGLSTLTQWGYYLKMWRAKGV